MSIEKDTVELFAETEHEAENDIKKIEKQYAELAMGFELLLFQLQKKYGLKAGEPVDYWKIDKKWIEKQVFKLFEKIPDVENDVITKVLGTTASQGFNKNLYILHKNLHVPLKFKVPSKTLIDRIVNQPIKGALFSDRLYVNTANLVADVKSTIVYGIEKGHGVDVMAKGLNEKAGIGLDNSRRIIRTEVTRVWNTAQTEAWKESGYVEQIIFIATLDGKTSAICREKDGKIFDLNDITAPIPPLHPNCRSTRGAYFGDLPKWRKDNITKEIVPYKTYEEWAKSTGKKP